uniref:EGF-like domain-containing protein n=1 Tax=Haplochromis burtoni TaxID=8153 RepID=A0A3Q2VJX1_HAPBU
MFTGYTIHTVFQILCVCVCVCTHLFFFSHFKDPCNPNPCGTGSTCEVRYNDTYVCLCLAGDSYNNVSKSCERSKVFPGNLQVKKPFKDEMTDTTSKEFIETANEIIAELDEVYNEMNGYSKSIVLKLLPRSTRVSGASSEVIASVQIIFEASSEITDDQVVKTLTECKDCSVIDNTFNITNLCDDAPCDEHSTNCKSGDGAFSCICNKGYMQTDYSNRMCIACPFGKELKDNECVTCSFGYSGFNCSENWQLILVIVGSVLGGLLLIAIILLPVVATQKSNKISKKSKSAEMEKPYTNLSSAAQPVASNKFGHSQGVSFNGSANGNSGFQNGGVPMFPRAGNPTNSMDNRTNLEMKPSNSRQNFGHMNSGSEYSSVCIKK